MHQIYDASILQERRLITLGKKLLEEVVTGASSVVNAFLGAENVQNRCSCKLLQAFVKHLQTFIKTGVHIKRRG